MNVEIKKRQLLGKERAGTGGAVLKQTLSLLALSCVLLLALLLALKVTLEPPEDGSRVSATLDDWPDTGEWLAMAEPIGSSGSAGESWEAELAVGLGSSSPGEREAGGDGAIAVTAGSAEPEGRREQANGGWKSVMAGEGLETSALRPRPPELSPLEGPSATRTSPPMVALSQPPERAQPTWRAEAVAVAPADGRPRIAVVIDDLGPAWKASLRAIELPGPLTLALLPYADGLPELAARARAAGHELIVHMPMEPLDMGRNYPGPGALLTSLGDAEIEERLLAALASFDGYVGINNHMGSAFTSHEQGLAVVMRVLGARGLLFLDSRTVGSSRAEAMALAAGVPATGRDVFLDNDPHDIEAIWAQLRQVEQIARRKGEAVAIGHPHATTLSALAVWLPELESRGFQIVPISALVRESVATAGFFANARWLSN